MPSSILNSDDGVISGTSGLKSTGGDDAVLLIQTNGTTAQTVDSGQRTKFPTTIGVGGATPSASGSGISFPATQSASSDANTLDDYEEGTWTPVLGGSGGTSGQAYSFQNARYTKVGNRVICNLIVKISTVGTITGNLEIQGLPFTSDATVNYQSSAPCTYFEAMNTSQIFIGGFVNTNSTTIGLYKASSAITSITAMTESDLAGNSVLIIATSYVAS
jgi:hypothetical protein